VIAPPDVKLIEPARVFRALLSRVPTWPISWKVQGIDGSFAVRAIGSFDWVSLHKAIIRAPFGPERTQAENAFLARVVVDADCQPVFASADDFGELYEYELDGLAEDVSNALAVGPTYAGSDFTKWMKYLSIGATEPENWTDMLSLGNCQDVSFGMGRGSVHVRDEPEAFFGIPRRDLMDCHWFAYRAAVRARTELMK
jgi:hypothetical protein